MMQKLTIYISLLFVIIAGSAIAQPAFTRSDFMQIGNRDTLTQDYLVDGTVPTATGSNYSWDFSTIKGISPASYSYRSPQHSGSEPFIALGATLEEWQESPTDEYALWKISNDTLYKMREGQATGTVFNPPYAQFVFPMSFGQTFSSTTDYYNGTNKVFSRQHTVSYDGFGSVKTKKGIFSNVFRMAIRDYDTNYVSHSANDYRAFWWLKAGGGVPVFKLTQTANAGTIYNAFFSSGHSVTSSVAENFEEQPSFFPNPTYNTVTISGLLPKRITLQNTVGVTLRSYETNNSATLDLNGLPSGMYFLSYTLGGAMKHSVIMKE